MPVSVEAGGDGGGLAAATRASLGDRAVAARNERRGAKGRAAAAIEDGREQRLLGTEGLVMTATEDGRAAPTEDGRVVAEHSQPGTDEVQQPSGQGGGEVAMTVRIGKWRGQEREGRKGNTQFSNPT